MKSDIHPRYREVIFQDNMADFTTKVRSTAKTSDTITIDGVEYPLVKVSISSASHPFYTGQERYVDTAGRIQKFQTRYQIGSGTASAEAVGKKKVKKSKGMIAAEMREEARKKAEAEAETERKKQKAEEKKKKTAAAKLAAEKAAAEAATAAPAATASADASSEA